MTAPTESRRIDIPGMYNLRDLGTLPVQGGTFRPREVYRSVDLAGLQPTQFPAFEALGVTTDVDLRTDSEIKDAPDSLPTSVRTIQLNVLADSPSAAAASITSFSSLTPDLAEQSLGDGKAVQLMLQSYRQIVSSASGLAAYTRFFALLADADRTGAVLFHCTTGKDRTGWAAASLLRLLGADSDTVYADYLQTNTDIKPFTDPIVAAVTANGVDPGLVTPVLGVDQAYLDEAFGEVDRVFGSLDGYLRDGLGVTDDMTSALRGRLVAPAS